MRSFQDIIEKQLKIVEDGNEIISNEEFFLLCEADAYRPPGEKWYSKHRDLTGVGAKIGAKAASILTLGLYGWYRRLTSTCRQNCKNITGLRKQRCVAVCNMNASKRVIEKIKSDRAKLESKIKDPEQRAKARTIIDTEQEKWESRYDKYKNQVSGLSAMVTQMQTTMKRKKK